MAYNDKKMKVDCSVRKVNELVKVDVENINKKIYWYIKFNLPLDEKSVSKNTMKVTDINGYIFETKTIYNKELELVIIEPLDVYKEEEYHILHIKKELRSKNLKNLRNDIQILFKVKGGQVIEFKQLGVNIIVPNPKKRTKKINKYNSKVYSFNRNIEDNILDKLEGDKLPFINIKFNYLIGLIGIPIFLMGLFTNNNLIIGFGGIISIIGFFHIMIQILNKEFKSNFYYNIGVINFNKENFKKADKKFRKSLKINSHNEFAEYAVNKVSFFYKLQKILYKICVKYFFVYSKGI